MDSSPKLGRGGRSDGGVGEYPGGGVRNHIANVLKAFDVSQHKTKHLLAYHITVSLKIHYLWKSTPKIWERNCYIPSGAMPREK
jgi:hypothetical protein